MKKNFQSEHYVSYSSMNIHDDRQDIALCVPRSWTTEHWETLRTFREKKNIWHFVSNEGFLVQKKK